MSTDKTRIRRAPPKFTGSAKVTLAAVSLIGFVGSWNLIAHVDNRQAQANEPPSPTLVPTTPVVIAPMPTPWPTIAPLPELQPVPTLRSVANAAMNGASEIAINPVVSLDITPIQIAPLPTMAPLPAIPDMPPPPPPPPMPAGGWQNSGGS